jgi:uncharacterized protein
MSRQKKAEKTSKRKTVGVKKPKVSVAQAKKDCEQRQFGEIFLDKDGRWFHCGEEITHERTIELFSRSVFKDPAGGYRLQVGKEWARIKVEDTPYIVRSVEFQERQILLGLNDRSSEPLAPDTLRVGEENVLYCEVKSDRFPARFTRPAYYQLMTRLGHDREGYFLEYRNQRWYFARNQDPTD